MNNYLCGAFHIVFLLWTLCPKVRAQCEEPFEKKLNLSVTYELPSFVADTPIHNLLIFEGAVYVGAVNRIYALSENLTKMSEYQTGPVSESLRCGPVRDGSEKSNTVDNINLAMLVETYYDDELFTCGSADNGVCRSHVLEDRWKVDKASQCMYSPKPSSGGEQGCPDCVAGASGARVLSVESGGVVRFFVGNSEIPGSGSPSFAQPQQHHTISVREMKETQDGFNFFSDQSYMDLTPPSRGNYYLRYVYSFQSGPYAYFLTVQQEGRDSQTYHTRIIRTCSSDAELRRYVEMPLECITTSRRRRRSAEGIEVFNVLQAAYVAKAGPDLRRDMSLKEGDDVLFAIFAKSKPGSPEPMASSAVCVIPISVINEKFIDPNIRECHTKQLYHFTGSDEKRCYNAGPVPRHAVRMTRDLVTSITSCYGWPGTWHPAANLLYLT